MKTDTRITGRARRYSLIVPIIAVFISMSAAGQVLEEIVVTAQKRAESVQDVPIAITALNSEKLERSFIQNIHDLSFHVPNLQFGNFSSTMTTAIRGIGYTNTTAGGDPGVAMHLDGVYLARPIANVFNAYDLDRMEVLRGPQGTLYGRNTTGGSINFISNKPGDEFEGQVDVSYGEFDHVMARGTFNAPINDRVATRFNLVWSESDGYQENVVPGGTESGDNDYVNARGSLRADFNENAELLISINYADIGGVGSTHEISQPYPTDTRLDFGPPIPGFRNYSGVPDQVLQTVFSQQFFNRPDINAMLAANGINSIADIEASLGVAPGGRYIPGGGTDFVALGIPVPWGVDALDYSAALPNDLRPNVARKDAHESNDLEFKSIAATFTFDLGWAEFKSISAYAETSLNSFSDLDATEIFLMNLLLIEEQEQFTQEFQLSSRGDSNLEWLLGAYYFDEEATRISFIFSPVFDDFGDLLGLPEGFNVGGDVEATSYAVFAQATYSLTDQVRITGGLRYSWDEKDAVINLTTPFPSFELATIARDALISDSWNEPTYKVVIDWSPTDDTLLYGSFSRGYKSGGINLNGTPPPRGTPNYDPEFVDVFEIGAKMQFMDRIQLNIAAFTNDFSDIQVQNFGAAGAEVVNAAAATIDGVEVEGIILITENTELNFSLGWMDAEFDDFPFNPPALPQFPFLEQIDQGNPPGTPGFDLRGPSDPTTPLGAPPTNFAGNELARAPEFTYSVGLQHTFNLGSAGSLTLRGDFYWQDEQFFDFDNGTDALADSFHNLDVRARWESAEATFFVEAFGTNVTDEVQVRNILISIPFLALGVDLTNYNAPAAWGIRGGYRF